VLPLQTRTTLQGQGEQRIFTQVRLIKLRVSAIAQRSDELAARVSAEAIAHS
jgi:hypothetical protein